MCFLCLSFGIFGYFISKNDIVQQLSIGIIVFGIGLIGFFKSASEAFENHRLDKHAVNNMEKAADR